MKSYPFKAPPSFVSRIDPSNARDPLLLQILPQDSELQDVTGFVADPLEEINHSPIIGLVHKYQDRVLLQVTDECAINCRFCFRRVTRNKILDWSAVFAYLVANPQVREVILSGGDPLFIKQDELLSIINNLADIVSIKRLRIHSRMPIIMPEYEIPRLTHTRLPIILIVHCNHPNEINDQVITAIENLKRTGVRIYNQSVLLRGINDNADILIELSEKLFNMDVMPYYLHMLDKVEGAAHFNVEIDSAKNIYARLQEKLPGYLVPKLVCDMNNKKNYIVANSD